jgi:hypothetical protein
MRTTRRKRKDKSATQSTSRQRKLPSPRSHRKENPEKKATGLNGTKTSDPASPEKPHSPVKKDSLPIGPTTTSMIEVTGTLSTIIKATETMRGLMTTAETTRGEATTMAGTTTTTGTAKTTSNAETTTATTKAGTTTTTSETPPSEIRSKTRPKVPTTQEDVKPAQPRATSPPTD